MDAVIQFRIPANPGVIAPEIYGHFAEHLGRCIYEGIWVGEDTSTPNRDGYRLDILAALTHLRVPVLRWPGGCFADDYHWRDGIGPAAKRPQSVNIWWRQTEPNAFGTHEFLMFCEHIGAAPYISANVGTGSPREARDWVEYCSFPGESTLTRQRARNGRPQPYHTPFWGIGNEPWGCGGNFSAQTYAETYLRFATYMRAMAPDIKLFACGASFGDFKNTRQNEWNHGLCREISRAPLVDYLTLHRYFTRGHGANFSDAEYYALLADVLALERDLELTDAVLRYYFPARRVAIAVDEWGVWHPEAVTENGLEQPNTLRDALLAASVLHLFNRWSHRVAMANLAQTINVLQCLAVTEGDKMHLTPTYHVFEMMRAHQKASLLDTTVESPSFEARPVGFEQKQRLPFLDACASISGKKVLLTVINKSLDQPIEGRIRIADAVPAAISGKVLYSESPRDINNFDAPTRISARRIRPELRTGDQVHVFPPHSFTALSITLESS